MVEQRFGRYRLIRKLATGGMAEVHLAAASAARGLQKLVVIKQVHPALAESPEFIKQFVAEARIGLGLNHPNIVQIFDFGQIDRTSFLAMEYVDGVDLLRLMRACEASERRVPYGLAAHICQQAACGLDYAHRKTDEYGQPLEIVHRDVSPQNLLVSRDGAVRVLDFGIARERDTIERDGTVKGKFAYMSPEQASGREVDRRSDVFSLGIILYELATGRPLYSQLKGRGVVEAVRRGVVPRPREVDAELPADLERIILRALAREPGDRFGTARDLQQALARFVHGQAELHDASQLAALVASVEPNSGGPADDLALAEQPTTEHATPAPAPHDRRERKHVVLICGALRGMAAVNREVGAERGRQLLLDFLSVAEHVAFKHSARVQRLDERGLLLLVGLPRSREEDAPRAIRLGRAMVEAIEAITRELDVKPGLSIGIQRGSAELSSADDQLVIDPAAQELAERLTAEAIAGEVLVGGGVYRLARDEFRFEPLEEGSGRLDEIKAYRLVGPLPLEERIAAGRGHDLVGREPELRRLRGALESVLANGESRLLLVVGPTGVGKRSLLAAFCRELDRQRARRVTVRAAGRPGLTAQPYGLVKELLGEILGIDPAAPPRTVNQTIEATVARLGQLGVDERAVIGATLRSLFGVLGEPLGGELEEIAPAQRQHRVVSALRQLLLLLARRPLLVLLANLHFADERSQVALTVALAGLPARVLGLATSQGTSVVRQAASSAGAELVELGELDQLHRQRMVLSRLAPAPEAKRLARAILAHTGGNPLFINEMIESLVERGLLEQTPSGDEAEAPRLRRVRRDLPLLAPTTVEGVIASRIDALDGAPRDLLAKAAVLGSRFSQRALAQLGEEDDAELEHQLTTLVERGLVTAEPRRQGRFLFANHIAKRVAYETLPDGERRRLHQRVATRLVAAESYRPGLDDARVARHLERAGDPATALQSYLRAAEHARANHANAEAFRLLGAALRLVPASSPEAFTIHGQREAILRVWGRVRQRLRELRRLERVAEELEDPARRARAGARRAALLIDLGRLDAAELALGRARLAARSARATDTEAELLDLLARARQARGDNAGALEALERGLSLCETSRRERRAELLQTRGALLAEQGELRAALSAHAEALVIQHRLGLHDQESRSLDRMGKAAFGLGDVELALTYQRRALRIAQQTSDGVGLARRLNSIGQTYAELGDAGRALPYLGKALQINQALGNFGAAAAALVTMGQLHLRCGNQAAAGPLLEQGLELAARGRQPYQRARAEAYLALWALQAGDVARCLDLARQARERAEAALLFGAQAHALAIEARAALAGGDTELALERSAAAMELLEQLTGEPSAEIYLHRALVLRDAGRPKAAAATLARGRALVERRAARLRDPAWRERLLQAEPARSLFAESLLDPDRSY